MHRHSDDHLQVIGTHTPYGRISGISKYLALKVWTMNILRYCYNEHLLVRCWLIILASVLVLMLGGHLVHRCNDTINGLNDKVGLMGEPLVNARIMRGGSARNVIRSTLEQEAVDTRIQRQRFNTTALSWCPSSTSLSCPSGFQRHVPTVSIIGVMKSGKYILGTCIKGVGESLLQPSLERNKPERSMLDINCAAVLYETPNTYLY